MFNLSYYWLHLRSSPLKLVTFAFLLVVMESFFLCSASSHSYHPSMSFQKGQIVNHYKLTERLNEIHPLYCSFFIEILHRLWMLLLESMTWAIQSQGSKLSPLKPSSYTPISPSRSQWTMILLFWRWMAPFVLVNVRGSLWIVYPVCSITSVA